MKLYKAVIPTILILLALCQGAWAYNGKALYNPDIGAYQKHQNGNFVFGF